MVINLFFLQSSLAKLNNYSIFPELCFPSNHTPITVDIITKEEFIQNKKYSILKNSKKVAKFMFKLIKGLKNSLKCIVQEYTDSSELIWFKHSHLVNIAKQSNVRNKNDRLQFYFILFSFSILF